MWTPIIAGVEGKHGGNMDTHFFRRRERGHPLFPEMDYSDGIHLNPVIYRKTGVECMVALCLGREENVDTHYFRA